MNGKSGGGYVNVAAAERIWRLVARPLMLSTSVELLPSEIGSEYADISSLVRLEVQGTPIRVPTRHCRELSVRDFVLYCPRSAKRAIVQ